jgi:N-acetyl-anhydromuramyl-L-alanine amidase AmpD
MSESTQNRVEILAPASLANTHRILLPPTLKRQERSGIVDRFVPAHSNNYRVANRGPAEIQWLVIHTVEGSEASCIATFQDPKLVKPRSAHYLVAKSGRITQMVHDKDIAWHVVDHNSKSIGIEHEGWAAESRHPAEMYRRSAELARYLCNQYGIARDRTAIRAHSQLDPANKKDPGPGWDWDLYIGLISQS